MTIELVTGIGETDHVNSVDDGAFNAYAFGTNSYFLKEGTCSLVDNNTVRLSGYEILAQGRHVRIVGNEDVTIENGTVNKNRIDLICLKYSQVSATFIESVVLHVIKGTPTSGVPSAPVIPSGQSSILAGDNPAYIPLYSVRLTGLNPSTPVKCISGSSKLIPLNEHKHDSSDFTGTLPISKGGTGASSASAAIDNLGGVREIHLSSTTSLSYADMAAQIHLNTPSDKKIYVGSFNNNGTIWGWIGQNCGYGYDWYEMLRYDGTASTGPVRVGATLCNGAWYIDEGKLGIARGGTGASTADQARINLGASRIKLLWSNGNPTNPFYAGEVTITGKSSYSFLLILMKGHHTNNDFYWSFYNTGSAGSCTLSGLSSQKQIVGRNVTSGAGDILNFGEGWVCSTYNSGVLVSDAFGIPLNIYGVEER